MVLQSSVRKGTAVCAVAQKTEVLTEQARAEMAVFQVVPLRLSGFFHDHVRKYDTPDVSGVQRRILFAAGGKTLLDLPCAMGICIYKRLRTGLGGTVFFWVLRAHADLCPDRSDRDGTIPAENVVFVLSDGNHDAGNLSDQTQKRAAKMKPTNWNCYS